MKAEIDFPLFLSLWNKRQRQSTPHVHMKIAHWLQVCWQGGDRRLLLMAFRSCGKSTIVGLFAAWVLYTNPALRLIVLAADTPLATRMVRNTKRIIERHPLTGHLRPDKPDQWAADRFTVNRAAEWRDPSMVAFGVSANITGTRADVIICDDVEVPNTSDSAEKRENLRERLAELSFVLVPGGTQLYVGTPHSHHSIYETAPGNTPDAPPPFLEGYKDLRVPVLKLDGTSMWPERFTLADIAAIKKAGGPRKFLAQMMLEAQPLTECRLSIDALQWYDEAIDYSEAQGRPVLSIQGHKMVSVSAWWDPAFGHGGDGSVVAIVFADAAGGYWLHHLEYIRIDKNNRDDEATQQCRAVAQLCRMFFVPSISLEINGIGRFLPAVLRRELAGAAGVVEISNRRPKHVRIVEGFDAVLAARALRVHASVSKTPFLEEMRNWKPGASGHDDGLDAVAGALTQLPVRLGGVRHGARKPGWHGYNTHNAKTNFNVME